MHPSSSLGKWVASLLLFFFQLTYAQITNKEGTRISGREFIIETSQSLTNEKQATKTIIYITKGTVITNLSQVSDTKTGYISGKKPKKNENHIVKSIKSRYHKNTETKKEIKNEAKKQAVFKPVPVESDSYFVLYHKQITVMPVNNYQPKLSATVFNFCYELEILLSYTIGKNYKSITEKKSSPFLYGNFTRPPPVV